MLVVRWLSGLLEASGQGVGEGILPIGLVSLKLAS